MVVGLGAGQQSRIHCTRLAGDKADIWWMRQHPRVLSLKWKKGTKRPEKSNAIDLLVTGQIPEGGQEKEQFEGVFEEVPAPFSKEERKEWMSQLTDVACSSDAFVSRLKFSLFDGRLVLKGLLIRMCVSSLFEKQFPFSDNVFRAARSGAKYLAAPTGSVNDKAVLDAAEQCKITFIEQSTRLFHH